MKKEEFYFMFDRLAANPWEYFPEKERIKITRELYWDKLKGYTARQIDTAFDALLLGENRYLPTIQRIITSIEACVKSKEFIPHQPFTSVERRLHKLFKRMRRQAEYIIKKYGNDRVRLAQCGGKYENLRRKFDREKNGVIKKDVIWQDPENKSIIKITKHSNVHLHKVNYNGLVFNLK